jgi:hypothetical protein
MCGYGYASSTYPGQVPVANEGVPGQGVSAPICTQPPTPGCASRASLGTSGTATGVGAVSPSWTLDNKTSGNKSQAEAIEFSSGPGLANNPVFAAGQIQIQRKDSGVSTNPFVTVQLAELDASRNVLATQDCKITGNTGTQITAQTGGPGIGTPPVGGGPVCVTTPATPPGPQSPPTPSTFQTVEVRDLTNSTSISVVGTSTFTLAKQVCGTKTIPATVLVNGAPDANLTLNEDPSVCKPYTGFTSTIVAGGVHDGQSQIEFDASGATALHFTLQMTWPVQSYCTPEGSNGTPKCAEDQVNFVDPSTGIAFTGTPAYCVSSVGATLPGNPLPNSPDDPYCTLTKEFAYNVDYNGTGQGTQITETFSSLLDLTHWH